MKSAFLLCAPNFSQLAQKLKAALAEPGVILEQVEPGEISAAKAARKRSSCLVLCWSSGLDVDNGPWKKTVARATKQGRCVVVLFEQGGGFTTDQSVDLSRWRGSPLAPAIAVARDRLKSCFSHVGRRRLKALLGVSGGSSVVVVLALTVDINTLVDMACRSGWARPICAQFGGGDVPTHAEEEAYRAALEKGCEGLREFVRTEPDNPRVEDAQRLLGASRRVDQSRWQPAERRLPLFIAGPAATTRAGAEEAARTASDQRARELCAPYGASSLMRLESSRQEAQLRCEASSDGWRCTADGSALCRIGQLRTETSEICG